MEQHLSEIPQKKSNSTDPLTFLNLASRMLRQPTSVVSKHSLRNFLTAALRNAHIQSTYTS